jgi:hypothetical protein
VWSHQFCVRVVRIKGSPIQASTSWALTSSKKSHSPSGCASFRPTSTNLSHI